MALKPDPTVDEYGEVDLTTLYDRKLEDLVDKGNPMERMTAAEMLLYVPVWELQERIEAVTYRTRRFGSPRFVKVYPDRPKLPLPEPGRVEANLSDAIRSRRSKKLFDEAPVTIQELSTVLFHCYGTTRKVQTRLRDHPFIPFRAAPTSGGLSGEEIYIAAINVEGLPPGLYHYNGVDHNLDVLSQGSIGAKVQSVWMLPDQLRNASCFLAFTIDLRRGAWKYHARYLRTALLDSGAILAYAQLTASAMGLSANPLTGFLPEGLTQLLKIDGIHEVPAVTMALGRPGQSRFLFDADEAA